MVSPRRTLRTGEGLFGGQIVDADRINAVRSLAREGLGRTRIQEILREQGRPLRGQSITEITREVRESQRRAPALNRVRSEFRPATRTITQTRINLATEFRVTARVRARSSETGEIQEFFARFGTNDRLTIGEIESRALDIGSEAMEAYEFDEIAQFEILTVEQRIV